jgi:hypothetical protein
MVRRMQDGRLVDVGPNISNVNTNTGCTTRANFSTVQLGVPAMGAGNIQFAGGPNMQNPFVGGDSGLRTGNLWGPERDKNFWTARAEGLIPNPEHRAMKLLASVCDEERFSLYCYTGSIAAMGNVTKHLYIVRRYCSVSELEDGRVIQGWCVVTRDRHLIPETDHVLALKSLIEGEELFFRATGNRTGWGLEGGGVRDPYRVPFLPEAHRSPNQEIVECEDIPAKLKTMQWKAWLSYNAVLHKARWKLEEMSQGPVRVDPQLQALRERLQGMAY